MHIRNCFLLTLNCQNQKNFSDIKFLFLFFVKIAQFKFGEIFFFLLKLNNSFTRQCAAFSSHSWFPFDCLVCLFSSCSSAAQKIFLLTLSSPIFSLSHEESRQFFILTLEHYFTKCEENFSLMTRPSATNYFNTKACASVSLFILNYLASSSRRQLTIRTGVL